MIHAARYISDRFLPDQAIELDDKAALSLRLAQESKPALEQLDQAAMTEQIELQSLRNQSDRPRAERRGDLEQALERPRKAAALEELWQAGTPYLSPPENLPDVRAERQWLQHKKERKRLLRGR